jgi:pimeloyl-ACP methyl ester carboxylesterase
MYPSFLPDRVTQLTESTSISMAGMIQQQAISTPLRLDPIVSAFVHQAPGLENNHPIDCPIVLLHGFDSSLLEFRRLLPALANHQSTWAIDLLGFGFTDRQIDVDFSPTSIKTHLYALWKTLIKQPMVLVGASMGGAAAIDFALTYPEAVAQLVLLDGAGFAKGPAVSGLLRRFPAVGRLATGFLSRIDVRESVSRRAYDDPALASADATCCAALHLAMPRWAEALIDFTGSGGYNFLSDKISQINQSTLIIWGRNDKILGTKDADRFLQSIQQSQLVWIEACGHVPHLEQPTLTATAILQFAANPESSR